MKYSLLFLILLSVKILVAQGTDKMSVKDSLALAEKKTFIEDHNNQLNVKFVVSNLIEDYIIPLNGEDAKISPNTAYKYALHFNYRALSLRLGFRPKLNDDKLDNKGDTEVSQISLALLFDKWQQAFQYSSVKGFYVSNSDDFLTLSEDLYIKFPNLKTHIFFGSTSYKLNDNYSVKATQSQTEIQLKSVGTFLPSANYWIYSFKGADEVVYENDDSFLREEYDEYSGVSIIFDFSYHYTFVFKQWYAHVSLGPGIGANFFTNTHYTTTDADKNGFTDLLLSGRGSLGIGYNSKKIHFGAEVSKTLNYESNSENGFTFQVDSQSFFLFLGYRFKAPKTIAKPVQFIEDKIPILDQDKNN